VENRFQSLPFKCNLQRYSAGADDAAALLDSVPRELLARAALRCGGALHVGIKLTHSP
jgi:hypothetical protein